MSAPSPIVFVVDDDPFQLTYLGGVLRTAGYRAEAFELPEVLLARVGPADRGCVVLDQEMPGLSGLDLQRALVERGALLPLVFVSGRAGVQDAVAAMKQGALDFLSKPVDPAKLCSAVASAIRRDADESTQRVSQGRARERWSTLSEREREVCRLSAKGLLNKQIAAEIGVTESTVQPQRVRAFRKLQVGTVPELMRLLEEAGDSQA